ncbi:MAG: transposase [Porphyromonadaceae bacterium]|nr:transposase [Porphyromonadaceae bacterium]
MKRRTFTAELKTKIILKVLRGEKELNVIATENELVPNQIRNWKAEFQKNATAAFEDK